MNKSSMIFRTAFGKVTVPTKPCTSCGNRAGKMNINWIMDADVSGFFDELEHDLLREFIKRRVNDGGILRLIGKWLNAGVMEEGNLTYAEKGSSPRGCN